MKNSGNYNNTIVIGNSLRSTSDTMIMLGAADQTTYINGCLFTTSPQITADVSLYAANSTNPPSISFIASDKTTPLANIMGNPNTGLLINSYANSGTIKFYNNVACTNVALHFFTILQCFFSKC